MVFGFRHERKTGADAASGWVQEGLAVLSRRAGTTGVSQREANTRAEERDGGNGFESASGLEAVRGDQTANASRCLRISSAMPASARASKPSSSSRRKAWPSAVPCSSMKPPPSFMTTFMSVSQSLSSA